MRQADIFLDGEGDAWLARNRMQLGESVDPVFTAMEACEIKPRRVLEVGCADGWRLSRLREKFGCEIYGVEPSMQATIEAPAPRVPVVQSSAAVLAVQGPFDLVIYGFCLYLTDPEEWLRIAAEGDSQLLAGGYLIVHDFHTNGEVFAREYEHHEGVRSYHFDFSSLWLASPLYRFVYRTHIGEEMVTVLQKLPVRSIEVLP